MARLRLAKRYRNSSLRARLQTGPQSANNLGARKPLYIIEWHYDGTANRLFVTFDEIPIQKGLPLWPDALGQLPYDCANSTETEFIIYYTDPVDWAVTVPFQDPTFRNAIAGYVPTIVLPV